MSRTSAASGATRSTMISIATAPRRSRAATTGGTRTSRVPSMVSGSSTRPSTPRVRRSWIRRCGAATNATIVPTIRDLPVSSEPTRWSTSSVTTSTTNTGARTGRTSSSPSTRQRSRVKQSGSARRSAAIGSTPTPHGGSRATRSSNESCSTATASRSTWAARPARSHPISTGRSCCATAAVGCRAATPDPKTAKPTTPRRTGKPAARPTSPTASRSVAVQGTIA